VEETAQRKFWENKQNEVYIFWENNPPTPQHPAPKKIGVYSDINITSRMIPRILLGRILMEDMDS